MNDKIELLKIRLEKLITECESLIDYDVVMLSQELDKHICKYYLDEVNEVENLE